MSGSSRIPRSHTGLMLKLILSILSLEVGPNLEEKSEKCDVSSFNSQEAQQDKHAQYWIIFITLFVLFSLG